MMDCLEELLGEMSTTFEVREVMRRLPTVSRNTIVYYRQKALNTSFHPGTYGGARHFKFSTQERRYVEALLFWAVATEPLNTLRKYVLIMQQKGYFLNKMWISRCFERWGLSYKRAYYQHVYKYKPENMQRYASYVHWIRTIDPRRLFFLDETRFDTEYH